MPDRTPRFISQFAALRKERANARPRRRWLSAALVLLLAAAAVLALYDMLR